MASATEPKATKKLGRPKQPVPQSKMDEIIEWISNGKTLRDYCRQEGKPSYAAVYDWLAADEDFATRYARARESGHDVIADECFQIADEMPPVDANGKTDAGYVAWQKNRIWTRTQLLAKWNPKKYGDKVDLTSDGKAVGLAINIDLGDK